MQTCDFDFRERLVSAGDQISQNFRCAVDELGESDPIQRFVALANIMLESWLNFFAVCEELGDAGAVQRYKTSYIERWRQILLQRIDLRDQDLIHSRLSCLAYAYEHRLIASDALPIEMDDTENPFPGHPGMASAAAIAAVWSSWQTGDPLISAEGVMTWLKRLRETERHSAYVWLNPDSFRLEISDGPFSHLLAKLPEKRGRPRT